MPETLSAVEYRDISGFPGYRVGSDGSVWSSLRKNRYRRDLSAPWRRLGATAGGRGYLRVKLCVGTTGRYTRRPVHQLVLEGFVGPCPAGMVACHGNDDPRDNRLENLRWDTPLANAADALRNGGYAAIRGANHYRSKLTDSQVREIRAAREAGEECRSIAARYGVSNVLVSLIARRKAWAWLK